MPAVSDGDCGDGAGRRAAEPVRRRDCVRDAEQSPEQIRGGADVEEQAIPAGQRQDYIERMCSTQYAVVLRRRDLCGQRHEADAE